MPVNVGWAAALVAVGVTVTACGSPSSAPPTTTTRQVSTTTGGTGPTTTVPVSTTTAVTAPPSTTVPATTTSTVPAGFTSAKQQWIQGASAISADQSQYLLQAATDLTGAVAGAGVDAASYQTAIAQLKQLASLPETSDTPAQKAEAQADVQALNAFFGTTDLYM